MRELSLLLDQYDGRVEFNVNIYNQIEKFN